MTKLRTKAFVLIAVLAGVAILWGDKEEEGVADFGQQTRRSPSPSVAEQESPLMRSHVLLSAEESNSSGDEASRMSDMDHSAESYVSQPAGSLRDVRGTAEHSEALTEHGQADVIGRPFPMADSVTAECGRLQDDICVEIHEVLSRLAEEPREEQWAAEKEAAIRAHLLTAEPGKFEILALECRTSVCAVQTRSRLGPYLGPGYEFSKINQLRVGPGTNGYESDVRGARVTISLVIFRRR